MTFSRGTTWGLDVALANPARVASVSVGDYWAREKRLDAAMAETMLASRFRGLPLPERVRPEVVRQVFAASAERDLNDDIAATGLPVLVATGTEPGCLLGADGVREWCNRVPGVKTATIDGATHDLFRGDRLAYPRLVRAFVGTHDDGAAGVAGGCHT